MEAEAQGREQVELAGSTHGVAGRVSVWSKVGAQVISILAL